MSLAVTMPARALTLARDEMKNENGYEIGNGQAYIFSSVT